MRNLMIYLLPICHMITSCRQDSNPTETLGSDGDATDGDTTDSDTTTTAQASEPTTTSASLDCEDFNNDVPAFDVAIVLRNSRDSEIFLVAGPCGQLPFEALDPVSMNVSSSEMCLEHPCVDQFCPQSCAPISPFLIAPGGVGPPMVWDGRLLVPEEMPLACTGLGNGQETVKCESLKVPAPGDIAISVFFASAVTGCDPEPCNCAPNDDGWCQIFPNEAAMVGNEIAVGMLEFPTEKMLEVVAQ